MCFRWATKMPERIKSWGLRISRAYASALSNTIKLDLIGKNMEARLKEIKDKSAPDAMKMSI